MDNEFPATSVSCGSELHQTNMITFDYSSKWHSCCTITKEPNLDASAIEPSSSNDLGISWDEIDSLITPFDILTLNVQNNTLYRFLGGKMHRFSVVTHLDDQPQIFDSRELDKFERLRPTP